MVAILTGLIYGHATHGDPALSFDLIYFYSLPLGDWSPGAW